MSVSGRPAHTALPPASCSHVSLAAGGAQPLPPLAVVPRCCCQWPIGLLVSFTYCLNAHLQHTTPAQRDCRQEHGAAGGPANADCCGAAPMPVPRPPHRCAMLPHSGCTPVVAGPRSLLPSPRPCLLPTGLFPGWEAPEPRRARRGRQGAAFDAGGAPRGTRCRPALGDWRSRRPI